MQADSDLVALVDDLLRTDPRLLAAAALVGKVAVVVTEPKPERVRKSTAKKRPPPRVGVINGNARVGDDDLRAEGSGPLDGPLDDSPKPAAAPWLKVAKAGKVGDAIRAAIGGQWLAVVTVDGGLWAKLRSEDQRRALALALRGLRHEEREDGSDKVAREAPPLQCWPDTADDLSHLVAALGVDGSEGAAAVSAAERLAPGCRPEPIAGGRHGDVSFWAEVDGEVSSFEIGWGHTMGGRSAFDSDADWSAYGFGMYEGGDLHDGFSSVRDVLTAYDFRDGVYLSLDDYRAGRKVTIESVVNAARAWAGLPSVADTDADGLDGPAEDAE